MIRRSSTLLALGLVASCAGAPQARQAVADAAPPPPLSLEGATAFEAAVRVALPPQAPGEYQGLHNVFALSPDIVSGAEPADRAALERLASWGIQTLLSVDGKVPDAETAAELGMRYVHVPIQYDGIDREEILSIAKTFRELEGPFYVHCYHGKHRGPAAAAIGRVVRDGLTRERAIAEMRQWCSTSSKYEGLYATVAVADLPTAAETAAHDFDFAAAHSFEGMRAVMIEMARKWDLVKASHQRGWQADPTHPDVVPLQEATQLHQLFEALADLGASHAWQDDFRDWLSEGREGSSALLRSLSDCEQEAQASAWRPAAEAAYERVSQSCASCHGAYRDR